jgi:hypothetical protein
MGKHTGYDLINGEYHIAPLYCEQFDELMHRTLGIQHMLNMVTDHAAEDLKQISVIRGKIFKELADDIGLDLGKGWVFSMGVIKLPKKEE